MIEAVVKNVTQSGDGSEICLAHSTAVWSSSLVLAVHSVVCISEKMGKHILLWVIKYIIILTGRNPRYLK